MTNKLRTLMAFSALSLSLAALPAFGGELEPLHVTVPFAFTAGKTTLPAGDYTVYENDAHLLTIRGNKGGVLILGVPGNEAEDDKSSLSFQRTDKGYSLTSVRSAGKAASVIPAASHIER
jgi:hypothetical protein